MIEIATFQIQIKYYYVSAVPASGYMHIYVLNDSPLRSTGQFSPNMWSFLLKED